jgi:hypothetical protein
MTMVTHLKRPYNPRPRKRRTLRSFRRRSGKRCSSRFERGMMKGGLVPIGGRRMSCWWRFQSFEYQDQMKSRSKTLATMRKCRKVQTSMLSIRKTTELHPAALDPDRSEVNHATGPTLSDKCVLNMVLFDTSLGIIESRRVKLQLTNKGLQGCVFIAANRACVTGRESLRGEYGGVYGGCDSLFSYARLRIPPPPPLRLFPP